MASLHNVEIEAHSLAILLQHPAAFGDFYLITRDDYSKVHQCLWDLISQQLSLTPPGSVAPLVLAEKAKGYGITSLEGGFEVYPYLEGLLTRFVEAKEAPHLARELKRLTVRRELVGKMDAARKELIAAPNASFDEMTKVVERQLTAVTTDYYTTDQFVKVFDGFIEVNEQRAANPLDASKMGWMGPFETMNRALGALTDRSLFITVGARTGNAKSALGFAYHVALAETHGLPILLLDCGEMTRERIRDRAACVLSKGRIPLWAIKSGEWAQNKEWADILRGDVYPRVKKILPLIDYINIGHLTPREKITTIRRFYYNRVGRGNPLCVLDDYLKGVEALGKNSAEYQSVGYYVNDVKNLITNEIPASFWTSVQNNRTGSHQGKAAKDIVDSDDQMGLSDRIIQQSDWGFILRWKVPEELASEKELFGNMRLTPVKTREAMGKEYQKALRPVKLANGKMAVNFYHLQNRDFYFTEVGDLRRSIEVLGNAPVDLGTDEPPKDPKKTAKPI